MSAAHVTVKRLSEGATLPTRAHNGDAAMDLYALGHSSVPAGGWGTVETGIAVAIPEGFAGVVSSRSGLAFNRGLGVLNSAGLIDSGYRGEVKVCLQNTAERDHTIEKGDRVAQLLIVPIPIVTMEEVEELPNSNDGRGHHGFGSTG